MRAVGVGSSRSSLGSLFGTEYEYEYEYHDTGYLHLMPEDDKTAVTYRMYDNMYEVQYQVPGNDTIIRYVRSR